MSSTNLQALNILKGQDKALSFLQKAVDSPKGGYIFYGPDGSGKRTAAILFAAAVNSPSMAQEIFSLSHPDIVTLFPFRAEPGTGKEAWLEEYIQERGNYILGKLSPDPSPSWVISIERLRDLRREMSYPPRILTRRVVLAFDFDRIREEGANAFLKTLEEPQAESIIILTSSRLFSLPPTIRSRCMLVRFNALSDEVIGSELRNNGYNADDVEIASDLAFGSLKRAYLFLKDHTNIISEEIFDFLEGSCSILEKLRFVEKVSYKPGLDVLFSSFSIVFQWILKYKTGRLPSWKRLSSVVKKLASRISRPSLVHNIILTQKMFSRLILNPTPSLFLYEYVSSLQLDS